jgi:hypothetical protein
VQETSLLLAIKSVSPIEMTTQRRGRNSNSNNNFDVDIGPDHRGHGSIYDLSSSLSSSPHPRIRREQQPSAALHKRNLVAHLVIIVLFVVLIVEFTAYRLLSSPSHSTSTATLSVPLIPRSYNINTNSIHHDNTGKNRKKNPPPSQQPTDTANVHYLSYEPTTSPKGHRLKSAISQHYRNAQYWKTHTPDPVPPLESSQHTLRRSDATSEEQPLPPIIAYVVTLTKCARPSKRGSLDGAAVLLHSIRRNSYGWDPTIIVQQPSQHGKQANDTPQYGGNGGRYRYRAYVIVDPSASPDEIGVNGECARFLQKIGYTVLHRPPLVPLFELTDNDDEYGDEGVGTNNENGTDIHGGYYKELKASGYVGKQRPNHGPTARQSNENPNKLRMLMHNDGCCGYAELLKLHIYGLVEHELAVHLDLDSLLLRPMDDLFDVMLGKGDVESRKKKMMAMMANNLPRTKDVDITKPIDAAFTRDYNSVVKPRIDAPVGYQGGFLVVKPSLQVLERYRSILQRGEFVLGSPRKGWGGKHGGFYGDLTFQGILPYYYEDVAPQWDGKGHNEIELNRCIYNQMADNPRKSTCKFPRATPLDPKAMGFRDTNVCRDGRDDCSDINCQLTHPKESITTHFTFSGKPWDCSEGNAGTVAHDTCIGLLGEWFLIRRELENWWWLRPTPSADKASQPYYWRVDTIAKVLESRQGALNNGTPYLGYCDKYGSGGYRRLVEPDN